MSQLSREDVQEILKNDFEFLDVVQIQNINGKLMMSDGELPHNVAHVMYEDEFVKKWLMPFAVGNDIGINYFKADEWFAISANGTRAVMVVDNDHKPLLVIAPMISHNLSQKEFKILEQASRYIHANSADTMKKNDPNANLAIAKHVASTISDKKKVTLTEMVVDTFYEKHGIIPLVEKQIYYIKDVINRGKPIELADLDVLRRALYANHRKERVSQEEMDVVDRLCTSSLIIAWNVESAEGLKPFNSQNKTPAGQSNASEREIPEDPLEC